MQGIDATEEGVGGGQGRTKEEIKQSWKTIGLIALAGILAVLLLLLPCLARVASKL
jgi:hypothetical protein